VSKVQRIRVTFARDDDLKYVTHLDMMRLWERTLRRAGVPLSYSEGFTPHAQIQLAAPLPVGTTSEAELMDVYLDRPMPPPAFVQAVAPQLPPAIRVLAAEEAGLARPSLQAETRFSEYRVDVAGERASAAAAIARFLAAQSVPWEHRREDEVRSYDIRALVQDLEVEGEPASGTLRLRMLLRNDSSGSGRPEQVAAALGLPPPSRIHRTRIILANRSRAIEAWRKHGRFQEP
jgi:radical SAM-linked protein